MTTETGISNTPIAMIPLMVDHEAGMATYAFPALGSLALATGALCMTMDEEHVIAMLCKHPVTGIWDYYDIASLIDPEIEKPKLSAV